LIEQMLDLRLRFMEMMDDDFNTAGAIGVLFDMSGVINRFIETTRLETNVDEVNKRFLNAAGGTLVACCRLLGLLETRPQGANLGSDRTARLVELLIDVRKQAREARQFQIADHVRKQLSEMGIVLEDRADGTQWRLE
jgi:cysteinyl-tRNA synthetase